jgi:hypothetical protein
MKPLSLHSRLAALLLVILLGCASPVAVAARNTFMIRYPCPYQVVVRERPDLSSAMGDARAGPIVEVSGCDADEIYACEPGHASTDAIRSRSGWTDASCIPTGWCTEPGCDAVGEAARNAFAKDKGCPFASVNATIGWTEVPIAPPEVAADPERMRRWTQFHQQKAAGHTVMNATGCGTQVVYDCRKPLGPRTIPTCKAAPTEEPEAAASVPDADRASSGAPMKSDVTPPSPP